MKKIFILAAFIFTCLCSRAQLANSTYRVLTGKIGGMDATLHLHLAGNKAGGYLWFNVTPRPMPCYASFNKTRDSLTITAHCIPLNITLKGALNSKTFAGESIIEKEGNGNIGLNKNGKRSEFNLTVSTTGFTAFDYIYCNGNAGMPGHLKNESTAEYAAATVWPKQIANKALEQALKAYVNREFNSKGALKEPGKIFIEDKKVFLDNWQSEMSKMTAKQVTQKGLSLSRQTDESINVIYEDAKVITLCHFNYEYTGGAHGNYASNLTTFNKKTGAIVKLSDILTREGFEKLPMLLEASVRAQYELDNKKTLEQNGLFVKKMEPSDNFYIINNSLGFIYSTYELMAYSYGEPNIFIPASLIGQYIRLPYKK